jgi:hypothetical protein
MDITLWLRKRKRRVISEGDIAGALMGVTSQHEFTLDEQVTGKVVAQAMLSLVTGVQGGLRRIQYVLFWARRYACVMAGGGSIRVLCCQRLL